MTKEVTKARPKRRDVFYLKPSQIVVEDGFNVREDYGNIDELAASIRENGVKIPLRGYKDNGLYIVTDGHRRLEACDKLSKQFPDLEVPFIVDKSERSMEQRVIDVMICNDGKPLNPLEEAEAVQRLLNYGMSEKEISKRTGKTGVYISNLKLLQSAPQKIKTLIKKDVVSATFAMKILRETESFEEAVTQLEKGVKFVKQEGKANLTQRDLERSQGKINSVSEMRKLMKKSKDRIVREDRVDVYAFAQSILNGEFTREDLDKLFFEPVEEEGED